MKTFDAIIQDLEGRIESSYTEGVTLEEAEKLAGRYLHAQMQVSAELRKVDLDSRMRKSGIKAVRASVYMDSCMGVDKKPTEATLGAIVETHEIVQSEQNALDKAESNRDELERLYSVFQNAHIHFRQMAKGNFGG